ncbi:MAG: cupin domain-containing protein [Dehalococcoidia bacterium]
MKNIININQIPWKTSEYEDSYLDGKIHQHKVKVADYVKREKYIESAESEIQHIGAYEYAPGGWISEHIHSNAEQWYYILEGKAVMKVGSEESISNKGSLIFIPRNTVHSYKVVGDKPLKILNVATFFPGIDSITTII